MNKIVGRVTEQTIVRDFNYMAKKINELIDEVEKLKYENIQIKRQLNSKNRPINERK